MAFFIGVFSILDFERDWIECYPYYSLSDQFYIDDELMKAFCSSQLKQKAAWLTISEASISTNQIRGHWGRWDPSTSVFSASQNIQS